MAAVTKIKFCGLRRIADVDFANALSPDYVGFVFVGKSRRRISPEEAGVLRARLKPGISAVGVFADETPEGVAAIVRSGAIDAVQLHGSEDDAFIARLRALCTAPVIKAFMVRRADDLAAAEASPADFVLLDAGSGGGRPFDWRVLAKAGLSRPYFLAGGLGPENVAKAISLLHPYAVDVSSGIETDGIKDFGKMERFCKEASR